MPLRLLPLLLCALAACEPLTDPVVRPAVEAEIRAFVGDWGGDAVLIDLECPEMSSTQDQEYVCTSSMNGLEAEWTVAIRPDVRPVEDAIVIAPKGFVLTGYLSHRITTLLMDQGLNPAATCGLEAVAPASPGDILECVVMDMGTSQVSGLDVTLTDDPDHPRVEVVPLADRPNPFGRDLEDFDTSSFDFRQL